MKLKRVLGWTALAISLGLYLAVFVACWMSVCSTRNLEMVLSIGAEAIRHVEEGHARGKIIIAMDPE